jgi:hypothetical protein
MLQLNAAPYQGVVVELIGHGYVRAAHDNLVRLVDTPADAVVFASEAGVIGFLAEHAPLILNRVPIKFHALAACGGVA